MATRIKPEFISRYGVEMRNVFDFKKYNLAQWFPGHMAKGYSDIQSKLTGVDCVIEVHDARIPVSGRNLNFAKTLSQAKPHVLLLNKRDMVNMKNAKYITEYYKKNGIENVIFTNCKNSRDAGVRNIVPRVTELIKKSERYNRASVNDYCLLITGIPNVGKSSLINALRTKYLHKGSATRVGAVPGITMSVLERIKVSEDPLIYLLDTPGILSPRIESIEVGLKLALVNTIKEHLVGEEAIADYLLYKLNFEGNHKYVEYLNIKAPTDDIQKLLISTAVRNDLTLQIRRFKMAGGLDTVTDVRRAALMFINGYRTNAYGPIEIDNVTSMK